MGNKSKKEKFNKVYISIKNRSMRLYARLRSALRKAYNKHTALFYIIYALLLVLIIETMARKSLIQGVYYMISEPYIFVCNALIILMTLSVTLLIRRRIFGISLISAVWLLAGATNAVLTSIRVTPFTASDLTVIDSAFDVIGKYFNVFQIILIALAVIAVIVLIVFIFRKSPKIRNKVNYKHSVAAIAAIWIVGILALNLGVGSGLIESQFGNLREGYYSYGFVYCFTNSVVNTGVTKPSDYSEESVEDIVSEDEASDGDDSDEVEETPNIIFLQLESFFDISHVKNIQLSYNPVSNFTYLYENYPSGYLTVPVVGAGTVNTEFEVMTGMNMDDFGPGEYPYKTILKEKACESICYNLKAYGYSTHAIHNNKATFYSRNEVLANLGYDTFTSIEYMNVDAFTPMGWAKDRFLTSEIMDTLESTEEQDFIYAISVQGHGSYPDTGGYKRPIRVAGLDGKSIVNQYEYYAWQLYQMDKFIGKLVDKLEDFDEDTILVMYGDHLPSLGLTDDDLVNGDVYQTQYVIWSNFDIEYDNEDIQAYQLQSKILEGLGMSEGTINSYHQSYMAKLRDAGESLSEGESESTSENSGSLSEDDTALETSKEADDVSSYESETDDENSANIYDDYLDGLHTLEYDMLYGENLASDGETLYEPTELSLGIHEITVNSVVPLNNKKNHVYIYGEYFNSYSVVYLNGKKMKTKYKGENALRIRTEDLVDGDIIVVAQVDEDGKILSETEEFAYSSENQ